MAIITEPSIAQAVERGRDLAAATADLDQAVDTLGNSGFIVCSVGLCTFCFLRFGDRPIDGIEAAIRCGGDTDTHAAIVGGWLGALHGAGALPPGLVEQLQRGPFGGSHFEALARALVNGAPPPRWSAGWALIRNLSLYPVVLAHGLSRLVPWRAPD